MKRLGLAVVQTNNHYSLGTRSHIEARHAVCGALRGQIGTQCSCAIYEQRPGNCRQFEVGGQLCKIAREESGLPAGGP